MYKRQLLDVPQLQPLLAAPGSAAATETPTSSAAPGADEPVQPLAQTLAQAERRALQSMLVACKGNRRRAAMELGISRASLYSKLQQHGLSQR